MGDVTNRLKPRDAVLIDEEILVAVTLTQPQTDTEEPTDKGRRANINTQRKKEVEEMELDRAVRRHRSQRYRLIDGLRLNRYPIVGRCDAGTTKQGDTLKTDLSAIYIVWVSFDEPTSSHVAHQRILSS